MRSRALLGLVLGAAVFATACGGGVRIRPPQALRPMPIAGFETVYGPQIPGDRQRLLTRLHVPVRMSAALRGAYPVGPGPVVRVVITQFRSGRWGPTRMHALVQVVGPGNALLNQFEVDATSVVGRSRGAMIQAVAQECVNQVAARL